MRYLVRALFYLLIIMEVIQLKCKCHARRRYDQHTSLVISVIRDTNIPRCKPYKMTAHANPFNLYFIASETLQWIHLYTTIICFRQWKVVPANFLCPAYLLSQEFYNTKDKQNCHFSHPTGHLLT